MSTFGYLIQAIILQVVAILLIPVVGLGYVLFNYGTISLETDRSDEFILLPTYVFIAINPHKMEFNGLVVDKSILLFKVSYYFMNHYNSVRFEFVTR